MEELRCCTYIHKEVDLYDADCLNIAENQLFKIGVDRGFEIEACIRDTKRTYRKGIARLIEKMEAQPFQALIIEEVRQLGTGKQVTKLLSLFQEHSVQLYTPRGELDLGEVIKRSEK